MATAGRNIIGKGTVQTDTLAVKANATLEGNVAVGANATVAGTSALAGTTTIGGGYGAAGATISDAGVIQANGAATIDGAISGGAAIKSTSATAGIGYDTGAGGAVTQGTSKSTGVTLSKVAGAITMHAAELAAGAAVNFTLTNTAIAATDVVVACIKSGGTVGKYAVTVDTVAAGSCKITLWNLSAGALAEAVVLNFVVIKGVAS